MLETEKAPRPTVDIIIEMDSGIVLVQRKYPPHGWALPGGFIEAGEWAAQAARREALEETGLTVTITDLLGVYSNPSRDPRGIHTVGIVYIATAGGVPRGGDDAAEARIFTLDALPADIAFDHPLMIADYVRFRAGHGHPPVDR
jgi:8-oxo-dGTP diphosphatase